MDKVRKINETVFKFSFSVFRSAWIISENLKLLMQTDFVAPAP
jgi:hypothetical protein